MVERGLCRRDVGLRIMIVRLPDFRIDQRFVFAVLTLGESDRVEYVAAEDASIGRLRGLLDFLGEIVTVEIILFPERVVIRPWILVCIGTDAVRLGKVLDAAVVPSLVLPAEYRIERRKEHSFQEKGDEQQGQDESRFFVGIGESEVFHSIGLQHLW